MGENDPGLRLEDFPSRTYDKVRYADTDRQGHVNNAAFATFCETGRVSVSLQSGPPAASPGGCLCDRSPS